MILLDCRLVVVIDRQLGYAILLLESNWSAMVVNKCCMYQTPHTLVFSLSLSLTLSLSLSLSLSLLLHVNDDLSLGYVFHTSPVVAIAS